MRKFKKGDRVEVVDEACAMERLAFVRNGATGTIASDEVAGDYGVRINGDEDLPYPWWMPGAALKKLKDS